MIELELPEEFGTQEMKDGSKKPLEALRKRLPDWEPYDEITLKVVPRYKTSGLSGDMWRTSVVITFKFKGQVIDEVALLNMQTAILFLGSEWIKRQEPIHDEVIRIEQGRCDQPSCDRPGTNLYLLRRETSERGEWLVPNEVRFRRFRRFCDRHARRGDCAREDNDDNYVVLQGAGPSGSTNVEESPAHVAVINVEQTDERK